MGAGVQEIGDFLEAGFEAAAVGAGEGGQEAPHFVTGAFGPAAEFLGARKAGGGFEGAANELDELSVCFGTQLQELRGFHPSGHFRFPLLNA